jgi:anti-sigma28 factor (negative regulator of flagellin synthesis)
MKITSIGQSSSIEAGGGVRARGVAEKAPASDEVQLTKLSTHLAAQSDSLARLGKVSQLTAAVASNGYHVDASVVSNSIIEDRLRAKAA